MVLLSVPLCCLAFKTLLKNDMLINLNRSSLWTIVGWVVDYLLVYSAIVYTPHEFILSISTKVRQRYCRCVP